MAHNMILVQTHVEPSITEIPQVYHDPVDLDVQQIPSPIENSIKQQNHILQENVDSTLRISTRIKRSVIFNNYIVYL